MQEYDVIDWLGHERGGQKISIGITGGYEPVFTRTKEKAQAA
jgi:hypothetical protein